MPDLLAHADDGPKGLRIGVPKQHFWDNLEPEVERLTRQAIADLVADGAIVREIDWHDVARYGAAVGIITLAEAAAYHREHLESRRNDFSDRIAAMLDAGARVSATNYIDAMRTMHAARAGEADDALDGLDVLLTPTCLQAAPTIETVLDDQDVGRRVQNTAVIDLTGQPAISVPCGLTSDELPVGLQIIGRRWDEAAVVRAARAYELVRGPFPSPSIS
jgi:aspartyl-tRNA(Asn)/glutamyl-tRNA(Gln) amidotransferase subunit A